MRALLLALLLLTPACAHPLQLATPKSSSTLAQEAWRSIVQVSFQDEEKKTHICAGFVVDASRGYVLTAAHCAPPTAEELLVEGEPTTRVAENEVFALLTIDPMSKPPLEVRKDPTRLGEEVLSLGFGYERQMVLRRVISSIREGDYLLDGVLVPGMSGGPVVDQEGRVVGLNQASNASVGVICGEKEILEFLRSVGRGRTVRVR